MAPAEPARGDRAKGWLAAHPEVESVTFAITDLNGTLRGKRAPIRELEAAFSGGVRMPISTLGVDVWGRDVPASGLVFETGDRDGVCWPTERGLLASPWAEPATALLPMTMETEEGVPLPGDPRVALAQAVERFQRSGLTPVVAAELEFYLVDPAAPRPRPPRSPATGRRLCDGQVLSVDQLDAFSGFLDDVHRAAEQLEVPAAAAIAESGAGQFELNLGHVADALRAADDALLLKRIVKGVARQHGFAASFMAKPYGERAGSGLHVHLSLQDPGGRNVFDDGSEQGSAVLRNAVAGLLRMLDPTSLLFAPHLNSFRRLRPRSHAPIAASWGYDNRTAAIRIPAGPRSARRLEHRVAGADANPYLVLAGVLGAAWLGIERALVPPEPVRGNAYAQAFPPLPGHWAAAIEAFASDPDILAIIDPVLQHMLIACKRQELDTFACQISGFEYRTYLETV